MARCFVTRDLPGPALDRLRAEHEVEVWPERLPPPREALVRGAAAAEGLLSLLTDPIDAELIAACPDLRAISNYAVGTDNVDVAAATARGIPVGNTPDVLTDSTADLALALMLAIARRLSEGERAVRDGRVADLGARPACSAATCTAPRSGSSAAGGSGPRSPGGSRASAAGSCSPGATIRRRSSGCSPRPTSSASTAR